MDEAALARVVALAIKAETAALLARIAVLEQRVAAAPAVGPQGPPGPQGERGERGEVGPAGLPGEKGLDGRDGKDGRDGLTVVGRDGAPGEKGLDGAPGRDGIDGKDGRDGVDGLGFEELEATVDALGRPILRLVRGDVVKQARLAGVYRGIFREGEHYLSGDSATWGGSLWIARRDTNTKPGEANDGWQLAVKKGADGKTGPEGKAGPQGLQGPQGPQGPRVY